MTVTSFCGVIGRWQTLCAFAGDIGVSQNTAKKMRQRNSIAPEHWASVVAAAKQRDYRDITLDLLARLKAGEIAAEVAE